MREDGTLDDLELPRGDPRAVKALYGSAFGWSFCFRHPAGSELAVWSET